MPAPTSDDIRAAIDAYRVEIMELAAAERAPALAHLTAAEQQLDAVDRWVEVHQQRREREAELARLQAERDRLAAEHEGA
jgi:hypothetical protein